LTANPAKNLSALWKGEPTVKPQDERAVKKSASQDADPDTPISNLSKPAYGTEEQAKSSNTPMDIEQRPTPEHARSPLERLPEATSVSELISESMGKYSMGGQ
jgi:hypothetical protein